MPIEVTRPKKEDILKCVARFDDLSAVDGGLPDQSVEGNYRTFRNAIGFKQPEGSETYSPIGDEAQPKISPSLTVCTVTGVLPGGQISKATLPSRMI